MHEVYRVWGVGKGTPAPAATSPARALGCAPAAGGKGKLGSSVLTGRGEGGGPGLCPPMATLGSLCTLRQVPMCLLSLCLWVSLSSL